MKLAKSTTIVSSMTLISRVMGFIRDIILAALFGAGPDFDAFVIAFKLPNFMRRLFADGAFSQAFVPTLADFSENKSHREVKLFVDRVAGSLTFIVLLAVIVVQLIAPLIVAVFAPGFYDDPHRFLLTTQMLRITFPYLLLVSLTSLAGAILNTHGKFAAAAFTPTLLNVGLIFAAIYISPYFAEPIYGLAWGVLLGGVAQVLLSIPFLKKLNLLPIPKIKWRDEGVRRVLKLMVPALFGVSMAQIGLLIDNSFASFLPQGSISWLYYSDRLTYLPLGVIGVAIATVVMPYLSRQHSSQSFTQYSKTLDWAIRMALLIGVPSSMGLLILAGPILVTLLYHGAFTAHDALMTRQSLWAFSLGLPGFMLVKIFASAFYSRKDIKTPVKIAALAVAANLVLNFILIYPLRHAGLALATTLSATLNGGLLIWLLIKRKIYIPQSGWQPLLLRFLLANVLMVIVLLFLAGNINTWFDWTTFVRVWHLISIISVGITVYFVTLYLSGLRLSHLRPPAVG